MRASSEQAGSNLAQAEPEAQKPFSQGGQLHRLREHVAGAANDFVEDGGVSIGHDLRLHPCSTVEVAEEVVSGGLVTLDHVNVFLSLIHI